MEAREHPIMSLEDLPLIEAIKKKALKNLDILLFFCLFLLD